MRDDYDLDEFLEEEFSGRPGSQRLKNFIIFVLVLSGFVWLAIYAYQRGTRPQNPSEVPLLTAENVPMRKKPEDPGGMEIPNQDKTIYEVLTKRKQQAEKKQRILPLPEAPEPPEGSDNGSQEFVEARKAMLESQPAPKNVEEIIAPKKEAPVQQKIIVKEAPKPTAAKPVAPKPKNPVVAEKPANKPSAISATTSSGGDAYRVQLASFRSKDEAEKGWDKAYRSHVDLLKGSSYAIERAEISGKGIFYRLQVKGFGSRDAASALCDKLKARNQGCYVVKK